MFGYQKFNDKIATLNKDIVSFKRLYNENLCDRVFCKYYNEKTENFCNKDKGYAAFCLENNYKGFEQRGCIKTDCKWQQSLNEGCQHCNNFSQYAPKTKRYRIKTKEEFEKEFGPNWRIEIDWTTFNSMDYLFGRELSPNEKQGIDKWIIYPNMILTIPEDSVPFYDMKLSNDWKNSGYQELVSGPTFKSGCIEKSSFLRSDLYNINKPKIKLKQVY
jgi:hypothetical protein